MFMKGYSHLETEECACARLEGVNASYKDLSQVCGRIRGKKTDWALSFLERAANAEIPVLYTSHYKNLGHRRELGGKKGRYPWKAAEAVLKVLQSAIANGKVRGLGEKYTVVAASANKKQVFPRLAPKGRWARANLETSRVEIILKGQELPKGVSVTPPVKKEEKKTEAKKEKKAEAKKEEKEPTIGKEEKKEPPKLLKEEAKVHEHKHEVEKIQESEKKHEEPMPHHHGEHQKR